MDVNKTFAFKIGFIEFLTNLSFVKSSLSHMSSRGENNGPSVFSNISRAALISLLSELLLARDLTKSAPDFIISRRSVRAISAARD